MYSANRPNKILSHESFCSESQICPSKGRWYAPTCVVKLLVVLLGVSINAQNCKKLPDADLYYIMMYNRAPRHIELLSELIRTVEVFAFSENITMFFICSELKKEKLRG